jgi:hypothetical protein
MNLFHNVVPSEIRTDKVAIRLTEGPTGYTTDGLPCIVYADFPSPYEPKASHKGHHGKSQLVSQQPLLRRRGNRDSDGSRFRPSADQREKAIT